MVRDTRGKVVLHSRKAFVGYDSEADFKFGVFVWGVESMISHHVKKVIFASQETDLLGAVFRLKAWPSFKHQVEVISKALMPLMEWRLEVVASGLNRGMCLIVQSVTKNFRMQSYVSIGYPM